MIYLLSECCVLLLLLLLLFFLLLDWVLFWGSPKHTLSALLGGLSRLSI